MKICLEIVIQRLPEDMKTEKSTFNLGKHSELNRMITIQTHLLITTNLNQNLQINKVKNL